MSNLKLCQGTKCHTYTTKDRIRGSKGSKHYETRRRSSFYYGNNTWYKDYKYNYDHTNNRNNNTHYFVNDLLGQKIPITEQEYDNHDLTKPNSIS